MGARPGSQTDSHTDEWRDVLESYPLIHSFFSVGSPRRCLHERRKVTLVQVIAAKDVAVIGVVDLPLSGVPPSVFGPHYHRRRTEPRVVGLREVFL